MLVVLVATRPFPPGDAIMLLGLRCAMLVPAAAIRRATAHVLVLDAHCLSEEGGHEIAT